MAYNILAINPGHNGSAALLSDGKLVYYIEEERLTRMKYDGNPFKAILDILSKWHVDELVIGGTSSELPSLPWTGEDPYTGVVRKINPKIKVTLLGHEHHLGHAACAFYNSGFEEAIAIIVDGAGSLKREFFDNEGKYPFDAFETESVWVGKKSEGLQLIHRNYGNNQGQKFTNGFCEFDSAVTITKAYEAVTNYLGFGFIEAGKTMGLASYGKRDENIPNLFVAGRGSKDVFIPYYPAGAYIDVMRFPQFLQKNNPKLWHKQPELLSEVEKNLAWQIQNDTQNLVGDFIEEYIGRSGIRNVVIAGGYGLNCVANYYFKKRFPDVEFYCEPIAHDGGTSIGLAKFVWTKRAQELSIENNIEPQTSIYYGPEYSLASLKEKVEEKQEEFESKEVTAKEIAQLISEKNIVAIFQGRSEAGPRALGNRSILYDPRDIEGKATVNTVKGREWFRPFAGSVLLEDADDWFDMAGLKESPFMMYAVNVAADKISQIPAVTHVDDTCRVQTVTEEQNKNYYNLIKEFKKITNVPVLFNTSFNLAGDPLVETLDDAFDAMRRSKLKYLYLPELNLLLTKTIPDPVEEEKVEESVEPENILDVELVEPEIKED
jgi:carbamoyltransferase